MAAHPVLSAGFTISGATVTFTDATQFSTVGDVLVASGSLIANTGHLVVGGIGP